MRFMTVLYKLPPLFAVNLTDNRKVEMGDFELLKVLGTGGETLLQSSVTASVISYCFSHQLLLQSSVTASVISYCFSHQLLLQSSVTASVISYCFSHQLLLQSSVTASVISYCFSHQLLLQSSVTASVISYCFSHQLLSACCTSRLCASISTVSYHIRGCLVNIL